MRRGRVAWVIVYVLCATLFAAGTIYYIHEHNRTSGRAVAEQSVPALVDTAFPVSMSVFKNTRQTLQGQTLEIGVQTEAPHGVSTIELWDGAHKIDAQTPQNQTAQTGASFKWPAITVGPHLLYARAVGSDGEVANSATYPIDVLVSSIITPGKKGGGAANPPQVTVPVLPGESAGDVAGRLGLPSASVVVNPEPTGGGTQLTAEVAPPAITSSPMDGATITVAPVPSTSGGVQLQVTPQGCGVTVATSGGSGPVTLDSATSGRPGFVVADAKSGPGPMTLNALMPGVHILKIQQGSKESTPVQFTVPQSCAKKAGWTGNVTLIGSELTLAKPLNHGYAYVSADGGPFTRIPANPAQFLSSSGLQLSVAGMMPALSGKKLTVEEWKQDGLTATQVGAGAFAALASAVNLADFVGEPDTLTVSAQSDSGFVQQLDLSKDQKVNFGWYDSSDRVTSVEWEVLAVPLSTGNNDFAPIGMLASGISDATTGGIKINPGWGGSFTIDTASITRPSPATAASGPWSAIANALAPTTSTVYVRVIGLIKTPGVLLATASGNASSNVQLNLPYQPGTETSQFKVDAVLALPGRAPNFDLADCVDVTGTHWGDYGDNPPYLKYDYPKDGTYCYSDFKHETGYCDSFLCSVGNAIEEIGEGLADLWDFIADAYNGIISAVVDLLADFNPICLAMSAASSSAGADCDAVGKVVARAAVSAVLESFGLPPSLPTSSQIKAIASGNLVAIGEQLLDQFGVPCDSLTLDSSQSTAVKGLAAQANVSVPTNGDGDIDACAAVMAAAIKEISGSVAQQTSDSEAADDGVPPCQPQWCTLVADPGGHTQPLVVNVIAHRVAGDSKPGTFPIRVNLSGTANFAPAPFQGGTGLVSTLDGNPNEIIAFLSFAEATPNFDIQAVEPGDGVMVAVDDPGRLFNNAVFVGLPETVFAFYGPKAVRPPP